MSVAAKVIGAVRLGLVDIKGIIKELNTAEMQQVPEIHTLLHESLLHTCMPSTSSKFAVEKSKVRSTGLVLVAVLPGPYMKYFDVESKIWKPLAPPQKTCGEIYYYCAETVGSIMYVAGCDQNCKDGNFISCYDIERNVWGEQPYSGGEIAQLCSVDDYMYAFSSDCNKIPQRYNFAERQWQSFAKANIVPGVQFYNSGVTTLHSNVFVLFGKGFRDSNARWSVQNASLHCFDPVTNAWEEKASTRHPHFGCSLFVVNNRLYVAGGYDYTEPIYRPCGTRASVEVYDEENNKWSVVDQNHIPQNKLGAVEIEGRIYFIINKFPVDSGIRIPPGEVYPVPLDEWKNLGNISEKAALCYVPLKREDLKVDDVGNY